MDANIIWARLDATLQERGLAGLVRYAEPTDVDDQQVYEGRCPSEDAVRALLPGGIAVLDLFNPHVMLTSVQDGQLVFRSRFRSARGKMAYSFVVAETDLAAQVQHLELIYDEIDEWLGRID